MRPIAFPQLRTQIQRAKIEAPHTAPLTGSKRRTEGESDQCILGRGPSWWCPLWDAAQSRGNTRSIVAHRHDVQQQRARGGEIFFREQAHEHTTGPTNCRPPDCGSLVRDPPSHAWECSSAQAGRRSWLRSLHLQCCKYRSTYYAFAPIIIV